MLYVVAHKNRGGQVVEWVMMRSGVDGLDIIASSWQT